MNAIMYHVHRMNTENREEALTLELLRAIDQQSNVTQRGLADRLGVALGLANSYLKRCARKGLIKVQQVPPNRYLYYLTPKGFSEKSRLTARYLTDSLRLYRRASEEYTAIFRSCAADGDRRVLLCGASELAEIAAVRAREFDVEIIGVFDPDVNSMHPASLELLRTPVSATAFDALVLSAVHRPEMLLSAIQLAWPGHERIHVPEMLGLRATPATSGAGQGGHS